jgi:predicted O-methyltransferase YrrM
MPLSYTLRAVRSMVRHPVQGVERIRGRIDRRRDRRQFRRLGVPSADAYGPLQGWAPRLHAWLEESWPCEEATRFQSVWEEVVAELAQAGLRVGRASYGGWNDADRAFAMAIWCLVAHNRPERVVETGVAHGLTSRVILEGLAANGSGHLWSIDLPAVDSSLHPEIGIAVPDGLRSRWTYIAGTSRERLPKLLRNLGGIDLFIHDSLHTGRNQLFELRWAWNHLRPCGVAVVDDVDHSLAVRRLVDEVSPMEWFTAEHANGVGLWGLAVKPADRPDPGPDRLSSGAHLRP